MSDMKTFQVEEPEHHQIVVSFTSGIARRYNVVADTPEEARDFIREHITAHDRDWPVRDVWIRATVPLYSKTFIKVIP